MKKFVLFLTAIAFSTISASALEPLILEPLGGYSYNNTQYGNVGETVDKNINTVNPNTQTVVLTPNYPANMIPQNNAAKGLPVVKKQPSNRIRIETKQGTRTNTQWNPGGKGTKSYF